MSRSDTKPPCDKGPSCPGLDCFHHGPYLKKLARRASRTKKTPVSMFEAIRRALGPGKVIHI